MKFNNSSFLNQLPTTSLGASLNSGYINIRESVGFALYLKWSGVTAAGEFKIQISNDSGSVPSNWVDLAGSQLTVAGAGDQLWNVSNAFFSYVRIVYTRTGGTGDITNAELSVKGY